jgi:hypothetical protein
MSQEDGAAGLENVEGLVGVLTLVGPGVGL